VVAPEFCCVFRRLCCARWASEVLVAALWWFPGWVAEGFVDLVHVEGVEEGGVGFVVGGGGDGRHGGGVVVWMVWAVVVYGLFDTSLYRDLVIDRRARSLTCDRSFDCALRCV
jgi:hypothetical protein